MLEDRLTTARAKVDELNRRLVKIEEAKAKVESAMADFEVQLDPSLANDVTLPMSVTGGQKQA